MGNNKKISNTKVSNTKVSNTKVSNTNMILNQHQTYANLFDNYLLKNKKIFSHDLNCDLSLPTYKSNYIIKNVQDNEDNYETDSDDDYEHECEC
jgi:hypothetical protein